MLKEAQSKPKQNHIYEASSSASKKYSSTIIALSAVMFLMNASFLMIYSLFPAYLLSLGHSQMNIGFLEGIFEFIAQMLKFGSGFISDILQKRKLVILAGCSCVFLGRSMVAFFSHLPYLIFGRSIDRIGNGIYSIPRDTLITTASSEKTRAQSLGLVRSLGQIGSVAGAFFASYLMKKAGYGFKDVFQFAIIPTFLILLLVTFKVKDTPFLQEVNTTKRFKFANLKKLGLKFALLMVVNTIFMLGRSNEAFMSTYAIKCFNMTNANVPWIMIVFNITWAVCSYPVGILSDKYGRMSVLVAGITSMLVADMFFFNATSLTTFFIGVVFWGIQMGLTTNAFLTLIADYVEPNLRGTAIGLYFLINAVCLLTADTTSGYIADTFGNPYVYLYSAFWAVLSLGALMWVRKYRNLAHVS
ncbi:MAG: MFS transporter [Alphaproteobacteria bacterium]|nr:MAG: MFS transporter [Alphaproteobacteria bacterium]